VKRVLARGLLLALASVAAPGVLAEAPLLQPLTGAQSTPPLPWRVVGLPRQSKPLTRFSLVDLDGRRALRVEADSSYGNLVHPLQPGQGGKHLAWQWRVDDLIEEADLRTKAGDDTALKVCVFFDLPLQRIPFIERQLMRLARSTSGEALPAATVCYVWDAKLPAGTTLNNAYTRRVRFMVLQSGPPARGAWRSERRDIAADFVQLFGEESPEPPPLVGVAIGADADNTKGRSLGHVTAMVLEP
jgi:hypothetical protein